MNKTDITTPIINLLHNIIYYDIMNVNYAKMQKARPIGVSFLKWHKQKLGKQKYCWTGFVKHWVWEFDNWRVYVSKEGASFEVLADLSAEDALAAWDEYYNLLIKS